jgi:hypothetical protein
MNNASLIYREVINKMNFQFISMFQVQQCIMKAKMILATQIGSLAMRVTNQFNHSRKIGKTHQNVLVFFKGDLKQIPSLYPELDFREEDLIGEDI